MDAPELIDAIIAAARDQTGIHPGELMRRAGLYQSAISRIRATGDCRFSTIAKLLEAGGLKLVVIKDNRDAELLAKGQLF